MNRPPQKMGPHPKALAREKQAEAAHKEFSVPEDKDSTADQMKKVADGLCKEAVRPLATNPKLRKLLVDLR